MSAVGRDVASYRKDLEPIIRRIMLDHTAREACAWDDRAVENILNDLAELIEKQEICRRFEA